MARNEIHVAYQSSGPGYSAGARAATTDRASDGQDPADAAGDDRIDADGRGAGLRGGHLFGASFLYGRHGSRIHADAAYRGPALEDQAYQGRSAGVRVANVGSDSTGVRR